MKVLSLFDGISCARVALERLGVNIETYYASEIEKNAIKTAQKNYPDTIQLGDITIINTPMLLVKNIDLMIGGSPCQDLSIATASRKGLDGERSKLFWEYVRVLKEVKPKYFVLENVASMRASDKTIITQILGVEPIMINASLVSAQARKRYFWTNIPNIELPNDRGIVLADILQWDLPADQIEYYSNFRQGKGGNNDTTKTVRVGDIGYNGQAGRVYCVCGKSVTINAGGGGAGGKTGLYAVPVAFRNRGDGKAAEYRKDLKANTITTVRTDSMVDTDNIIRKLTPIECERLQGLPDNYTEGLPKTQRIKALGNGFNVDVIAHIISHMPGVK